MDVPELILAADAEQQESQRPRLEAEALACSAQRGEDIDACFNSVSESVSAFEIADCSITMPIPIPIPKYYCAPEWQSLSGAHGQRRGFMWNEETQPHLFLKVKIIPPLASRMCRL